MRLDKSLIIIYHNTKDNARQEVIKMRETTQYDIDNNTMTTNTTGLMKMLGCGRVTAVKIGTDAEAKVQVGKRVLWNLPKTINKFHNILL